MADFLAQVVREARARVSADAADEPLADLRQRALATPRPPAFADALSRPGVAVIAEVKRASPSRGPLARIPDPAALARSYADGGAAAVSVLTEPRHFHGELRDLTAVAGAAGVPVLRKDFVVDAYQVVQARAAGAAAVLLIVAALTRDDLARLLVAAAAAGLHALVEVHDEAELVTAASAYEQTGAAVPLLLGINARDLVTLSVDAGVFSRLRHAAPDGALLVAESGVRSPDDVRARGSEGADAVLVGEHVAIAPDPAEAVRALVVAGRVAMRARLPGS